MILANLRHLARTGTEPAARPGVRLLRRRGGRRRAGQPLARRPPPASCSTGVTEAISEVGGYSVTVPDAATGEPAAPTCCRPPRRASPGCGCAPTAAPATARCPTTTTPSSGWPRPIAPDRRARVAARVHRLGPRAARRRSATLTGVAVRPTTTPTTLLGHLGGAQGFVRGTLQDTANVTMLEAGYKHNVIPQTRRRPSLDCRFLPGHEDDADGHDPRAGRASTSRSRSCTATSPSTRRSTATWSSR